MSAKIKSHNTSLSHRNKPRKVTDKAFEKVYWPYIPLVLAISGVLFLGTKGGVLNHPLGKVMSYASSMQTSQLLSDTNADRINNQERPLKINDRLTAAAQAKANDMAARDYWSHQTPNGEQPWIFVAEQSYDYQKLGENLATGFANEQATVDGWYASPPHRENLLDPDYTEVGFGIASVPDYKAAGGGPMTLVVAFYGEPAGVSLTSATNIAINSPPIAPNTANPNTNQVLSSHTSKAQLAVFNSGLSKIATQITTLTLLIVIVLWCYRHIRIVHRSVVNGEKFVIHHPLVDFGVIVLIALLIILTQTAGLIQ